VNAVDRRGRRRERRESRQVATAIATAALFGAASVFGLLAVRAAVDASVVRAPLPEQAASGVRAADDAAVAIAPRMRPVPPAGGAAVVAIPPLAKTPARATLVAVSVPTPASPPAPMPASRPDAGMAGAIAGEPLRTVEATHAAERAAGGDPTHGGGAPAPAPSREDTPPSPDVE
jgi:hypothetical protein